MISSLLLIAGNRDIDTVETISKSDKKPNIIFILSDDHTTNAISAYGSIYKDIAPTPNIDKIAKEGAILKIHLLQIQFVGQVMHPFLPVLTAIFMAIKKLQRRCF